MTTKRAFQAPNQSSLSDVNDRLEWLTTKDAAAYLKISPKTLLNLSSNGKVKYYKFGRRNRYQLSDLNRLLFAEEGVVNGN